MTSHSQLKALLIDLNGTLHVGSEPTPRAVEAIARLRRSKLPFLFWLVITIAPAMSSLMYQFKLHKGSRF